MKESAIKKRALLTLVPILLLAAGVYFGIQFIVGFLWSAQPEPPPAITVEAIYPGASAAVVAESVAAPIEMHVTGVEQMVAMRSRCDNDGHYSLTVTFPCGADLNIAKVLVQNRIQLALPALPETVRQGITAKEKSPGFQLVVNVSSPDGSRDSHYLNNYVAIQLKDELTRLVGVSEILVVGKSETRIRIELDLHKLATHNMTVNEVVGAIQQQTIQVAGTKPGSRFIGQPPPWILEQARDDILKVEAGGRILRLKDVARVDNARFERNAARFNGKPVTCLFVYPLRHARLREVRYAIEQKLHELRERLPKGLSLDVAFDFTTNLDRTPSSDHLWLDLNLPVGAPRERTLDVLDRSAKMLRTMEPVWNVIELSGPPFAALTEQGCILLRLAPADRSEAERAEIIQTIRDRLAKQIPDAAIRLRDLSAMRQLPPGAYPIHLAVYGPEADKVRAFAAKLVDRLRQSPKLTDVNVNPESALSPQEFVDIDRDKARRAGVSLDEITTLAVCFGAPRMEGFGNIDLCCSTGIRAGEKILLGIENLKHIKVRSKAGELIPLTEMVKVREVSSPRVVQRLDTLPMEEITANPALGVPLAEARSVCASLAEIIRQELRLTPEYRLACCKKGSRIASTSWLAHAFPGTGLHS